jgi:hypothetical protein
MMLILDDQYIADMVAFKKKWGILHKDEERVAAAGEIHRNDFMLADIDDRETRIKAMPEFNEINEARNKRVAEVLRDHGFTVIM